MELVEQESKDVKVMELAAQEKPAADLPETFVEPQEVGEIPSVAASKNLDEPPAANAATDALVEVALPSDAVLAELKLNPIHSIEIRKAVEVPPLLETENPQLREPADQARAVVRNRPPFRFWPVDREPWTASRDSFAFHHHPLWFETPNLERCGRGQGRFTSVVSFLNFNANVAFLPYRMTAERASGCVQTLPDCTVCQRFGYDAYLPPWSWRAAAVQTGAVFGFIYAIP